jgi:hypothetical protein
MIFVIVVAILFLFGFVVFFGAPYVPSKKGEAARALDELYALGPKDTLVDIGSGDGIILRLAAKRGARAVGYEINPILVLISRLLSRATPNVTVHFKSFWSATLPKETTVVYVFGDSRDIAKMAKKVEDTATAVGRKVYFISYAIAVPGHTPVRQVGAHYLYEFDPLQIESA